MPQLFLFRRRIGEAYVFRARSARVSLVDSVVYPSQADSVHFLLDACAFDVDAESDGVSFILSLGPGEQLIFNASFMDNRVNVETEVSLSAASDDRSPTFRLSDDFNDHSGAYQVALELDYQRVSWEDDRPRGQLTLSLNGRPLGTVPRASLPQNLELSAGPNVVGVRRFDLTTRE